MVDLTQAMEKGELPKLNQSQIEAYLLRENRSAESLLSAFRLSDLDPKFLEEALKQFPNNPQVLMTAIGYYRDPTQRLDLLERFTRSDPDNALGYLLTARTLFEMGNSDGAMEQISRSEDKSIGIFLKEFSQNDEEVYLSSGFTPLESKLNSQIFQSASGIMEIRQLSQTMDDLAKSYASAGNTDAADALREQHVRIGRQLQSSATCTVEQLVGIVVENQALKSTGSTEALNQIEHLKSEKEVLANRARQVDSLRKSNQIPDSDWLIYYDRVKIFNEQAANEWLLNKHKDP